MNVGLLILRLTVGLVLSGHGAQKLLGWLGRPGLDRVAGALASMGYRPSKFFAGLAGITEMGGGLLLAIGLLTPLAAAAIAGTMLTAALAAHVKNGFWNQNRGYEYPLVLGMTALGLAFTGAGSYSLDHLAGWNLGGSGWGVLATALALVSGLGTDFYRRHTLTAGPGLGVAGTA